MASTWSDLKFELIGTGDQSGTWGATTNDNLGIAIQQAIGGRADVTMSSTTITLTLTDTTALQNARALYLNLTGTPGGAATLNVPAVQKAYVVYNNTTGGFAVTVKVSGQTGVSVPNGKSMLLYDNGTDVVDAVTHLSSLTLGSALPIASGGTGTTSTTFVNLASNVTGTLPIANGGTGTTSTTFVNLASNVTGQLPLSNGGTGANLTDPNADRILFWDDSATSVAFLEAGSGLSISGTTLSATASFATPLIVVGNATAGSEIRLPEDTDNGSNYVAIKAPDSIASNATLTAPAVTDTIATIGTAQTFTAAQTFRAANAIRSEAANTQDAIVLAGRAGGTSSYAATLTPATLSANVTLTLPATTATLGYLNLPAVGTKTGSYTLAVGDVGKYVQVGSGGSITIPDATFAEGDVVIIANNTSGNITITCTITTAYIAGTDSDKATVTLATRGFANIVFLSGTVCIISGNVS